MMQKLLAGITAMQTQQEQEQEQSTIFERKREFILIRANRL